MAPPHRASCLNCIKAKRRCNFAVRQCQRCAERNLVCDHPSLARHITSAQEDILLSSVAQEDWMMDSESSVLSGRSGDGFGQRAREEKAGPVVAESGWLAQLTNEGNDFGSQSPFSDFPAFLGNQAQIYQMANVDEINNGVITSVDQGEDYTTGTIYYERVSFVSRQLKTYPEMFYKRGWTPFIHRCQYRQYTPLVIHDALASCAMYIGKTAENESLIYGHLSNKALDLAGREGPFSNPVEMLASTQVLLMYQIIRLFDGDIRQRAEAEAAEPILMKWAAELSARTQQVPSILSCTVSRPAGTAMDVTWNDWIFKEACRRTVLTAYMLQGVYSFLKFGFQNVSNKVENQSFTANAELWRAPSEYCWKKILKEKKAFEVRISQWDMAMEGVTPEDLDGLGIIMLATHKGIDITCEWLGRENLAHWGLE